MTNDIRPPSIASRKPKPPVRCHRCLTHIEDHQGYWFALSPWGTTSRGLPITGHLYCEVCADQLYDEARRIRRMSSFITRFLLKRRRPDRFQTTMQASQQITQDGLSKEQWKTRCQDGVAWWWQRHKLVSKGIAPSWVLDSDVHAVIGKYLTQTEPWQLCDYLCDRSDETPLVQTVAQYDDLIQRFPDFAAYALYCRGVWRQSLTHSESGTLGLSRALNALQASPGFRGAMWLGTPSRESIEHAQAAKADLTTALERDPQLHWAYFYRSACNDTMGDAAGARSDGELALQLCPSLNSEWNFLQRHASTRGALP